MIDITQLNYLTQEQFLEEIARNNEQIRQLISDNDLLIKAYVTDRRLTSEECAEYLHCAVSAIPKEIYCTKVGRTFLYSIADIQAYLTKNKKSRKS